MARVASIRDEDILAAARRVFLARGILATTAEVAADAGVSEALVFKRFRTKANLFRRALEAGFEASPWQRALTERVGQGDVRDELAVAALEAIRFLRVILPLTMMAWSNPGPSGLPEIFTEPNPPPLRALGQLTAYLEAEMAIGRIRPQDADIVARTLAGAVFHYVYFESIFRAQQLLPVPEESFVRGLVELLWPGLAPRP
ncbi:MAG: helix-turn-helix domain-containing protein [Polyangiales bacterium]